MNIYAKAIKIQFITYPVRLLHILHVLISAQAVHIKAALTLASGAVALVSKVQALALRYWLCYITGINSYTLVTVNNLLLCNEHAVKALKS